MGVTVAATAASGSKIAAAKADRLIMQQERTMAADRAATTKNATTVRATIATVKAAAAKSRAGRRK